MNNLLCDISSRFNVKEKYEKYLNSINESSAVKLHSIHTLKRYLDRPGYLSYVEILNLKFPNNREQLKIELDILKTGLKYSEFFDRYKDKLPTEIIEIMYFDTNKFSKYVYYNYIIYWLFDKDFGKHFPSAVEDMALLTLSPNNLLGANINNIYKTYDYMLSRVFTEKEYKLELLVRLTELEYSLLEISEATFTYIDILDSHSITLLQTDITGKFIKVLYTTPEYFENTLQEQYEEFNLSNSIIFTCQIDRIKQMLKNNFILGYFDFNDKLKQFTNIHIYQTICENLYVEYNMDELELLSLFDQLKDYNIEGTSLKNVLIMYNSILKSKYLAYK